MSPRLTTNRLRLLVAELPGRYTTPLPHLAAARLLTGAQLDRLLAASELSSDTVARVRRRIMTRLASVGLVATLSRRVGGVRAGSAGHVYVLTSAGHRFLALTNGEPEPGRIRHAAAPGPLFLSHALTISAVYVDLIEHGRRHGFRVASFATEPHCWHPTGNGGFLRPDAYAVLQTPRHRDYWWLEIDAGTESPRRLRAKADAYRRFLTSGGLGPHGYPPRLLVTAPDPTRVHVITAAMTSHDGDTTAVTTHADAAHHMTTQLNT